MISPNSCWWSLNPLCSPVSLSPFHSNWIWNNFATLNNCAHQTLLSSEPSSSVSSPVMNQTFVSQNSYVETAPSHMMVLAGGTIGGNQDWIRSWECSPHDGISVLMRIMRAIASLLCPLKIQWKVGLLQPITGPQQNPAMLAPWSWTSSLQNFD